MMLYRLLIFALLLTSFNKSFKEYIVLLFFLKDLKTMFLVLSLYILRASIFFDCSSIFLSNKDKNFDIFSCSFKLGILIFKCSTFVLLISKKVDPKAFLLSSIKNLSVK